MFVELLQNVEIRNVDIKTSFLQKSFKAFCSNVWLLTVYIDCLSVLIFLLPIFSFPTHSHIHHHALFSVLLIVNGHILSSIYTLLILGREFRHHICPQAALGLEKYRSQQVGKQTDGPARHLASIPAKDIFLLWLQACDVESKVTP